MPAAFVTPEPLREDVNALPGETLLEFGTDWCEHCQAAQDPISTVLAEQQPQRHWRIEDGRGRPLGRSYAVKLWPTLILLRDGQEVARWVRPAGAHAVLSTWPSAATR